LRAPPPPAGRGHYSHCAVGSDRPLALGGPGATALYDRVHVAAGILVCHPAHALAAAGDRQRLLQLAGCSTALQQPVAFDTDHRTVSYRLSRRILLLCARLSAAAFHHLLCCGLAHLDDGVAWVPALPHWLDRISPPRDNRRRGTRGRDHHARAHGGGR